MIQPEEKVRVTFGSEELSKQMKIFNDNNALLAQAEATLSRFKENMTQKIPGGTSQFAQETFGSSAQSQIINTNNNNQNFQPMVIDENNEYMDNVMNRMTAQFPSSKSQQKKNQSLTKHEDFMSLEKIMGLKTPSQFAYEQSLLIQQVRQQNSSFANKTLINPSSINKKSNKQSKVLSPSQNPNIQQSNSKSKLQTSPQKSQDNRSFKASQQPSNITEASIQISKMFLQQKNESTRLPANVNPNMNFCFQLEQKIVSKISEQKKIQQFAKNHSIKNFKEYQNSQIQKLYYQDQQKVIKSKEDLKQKFDQDQNKIYTFQPDINKNFPFTSANLQNKPFLEKNKKMQEEYKKNKENLKQKLETEYRQKHKFKPEITTESQEIANNLIQKSGKSKVFHQRLYEVKKNHMANGLQSGSKKENAYNVLNISVEEDNNHLFFSDRKELGSGIQDVKYSFSPQISKFTQQLAEKKRQRKKMGLSGSSIHDSLYEDAIQKKIRFLSPQSKVYKSNILTTDRSQSVANIKSIQKQTHNFLRKFFKEFTICLNNICPNKNQMTMHYLELVEMLKQMGFLRDEWIDDNNLNYKNQQKKNSNSQILQEIWNVLKESDSQIITRNLLVFLLAVMNIKVDKNQVPTLNEQSFQNLQALQKDLDEYAAVNNQNYQLQQQQQKSQQQYQQPQLGGVRKNSRSQQTCQFGEFDDFGNIEISQPQVKQINKHFKTLYLNRISKAKEVKTPEQMHPYSPQISKLSKQLAQKKQEKKLIEMTNYQNEKENQENMMNQQQQQIKKKQKVSHADLMLFQKVTSKNKLKELQQFYHQNELENCTFSPKLMAQFQSQSTKARKQSDSRPGQTSSQAINEINEYDEDNQQQYKEGNNQQQRKSSQKLNNRILSSGSGLQRGLDLYNLRKPFQQQQQPQKTTQEIEYEKQCDECTFQPNIKPSQKYFQNKKSSVMNTSSNYNGVDKAILRQRQAYVDKILKKTLKDKGHTYNQNILNKLMNISQNQQLGDSQIRTNSQQNSVNQSNQQLSKHQLDGSELYQSLDPSQQRQEQLLQQQQPELIDPQQDQQRQSQQQDNMIMYSDPNDENIYMSPQQYQQQQQQLPLDQQQYFDDDQAQQQNQQQDNIPLLHVFVKITDGNNARITINRGDDTNKLAEEFAQKHGLDEGTKEKLKALLDIQLKGLLPNIDEELSETNSHTHL